MVVDTEDEELEARDPYGPEIKDETVELHRQVRPAMWEQAGRPSSQMFTPMDKDKGLLSVSDGRVLSAQDAYARFVASGFDSRGTLSVSVAKCIEQGVPAFEDRLTLAVDGIDDDAHAVVNFRRLSSKSKRKRVAKKLAAAAKRSYEP